MLMAPGGPDFWCRKDRLLDPGEWGTATWVMSASSPPSSKSPRHPLGLRRRGTGGVLVGLGGLVGLRFFLVGGVRGRLEGTQHVPQVVDTGGALVGQLFRSFSAGAL